jgi:cytoskeletal protein CcmA (bactofilin family)
MQTFEGKHEGDLALAQDLELGGMIAGSVIVPPGISLVLRGMITGDLIVQDGGQATIHGMVVGTLHNEGGAVRVFGMVRAVVDSGASTTVIADEAVITGAN